MCGHPWIILALVVGLSSPTFQSGVKPTTSSAYTSNVVSVNAPSTELAQGYLAWLHKHPELRPGSGSKLAQGGKAGDPYKILWPTLDIYSAAGVSIFHGNDAEENNRIIKRLPTNLPQADAIQGSMRPTLDEAMAMFPEFSKDAIKLPARARYTVFVITNEDRPACSAQDQAVQELKKRVRGSQVRIVEVRVKAEN